MKRPVFARGRNDLLYADDGRIFIDLFAGHGAAFLGHAEPSISAAIAQQLERLTTAGGLDTTRTAPMRALLESFFPEDYALAALYSTGMEAAEFALRFARVTTGRAGAIGFEGDMHGKSLATATLGWDNRDGIAVPAIHRLPFLARHSEADILQQTQSVLADGRIGAVFVEPVQGSSGAVAGSAQLYREIARLARQHGALLVFDEILTGFHRTGPAFCFMDLGLEPDAVLIGKTLGNGFPVSAVMANRRYRVQPAMLPGSTYAGNALACAAVTATLERLREIDIDEAVARIGQTIERHLAPLGGAWVRVRGRGALWMIELPTAEAASQAAMAIFEAGVCIGIAGRYLRLLPAATIETEHLEQACAIVAREVRRAVRSSDGSH